jgi:predicted Zn-dependent protease with MMP-like domain
MPQTTASAEWTDRLAPSLDDFAAVARAAFDALPEPFRSAAGEVVLRIEPFRRAMKWKDFEYEPPSAE